MLQILIITEAIGTSLRTDVVSFDSRHAANDALAAIQQYGSLVHGQLVRAIPLFVPENTTIY